MNAPTNARIGAYTSERADCDWLYVLEDAEVQHTKDFTHLHQVFEASYDALVRGVVPSACDPLSVGIPNASRCHRQSLSTTLNERH